LHEIELWEVSLVTFPMLPGARVEAEPSDAEADLAPALAESFREARALMA
jgi:phage head maturation protease